MRSTDNNLSLAGKRPVQIKSQIQYLRNVLGFHSAVTIASMLSQILINTKHEKKIQPRLCCWGMPVKVGRKVT